MVTKAQFKNNILLTMGKGAINPNLTDEQLELAIKLALDFFIQYASDAVDYKYLKYQITQQDIDRGDNSIFLPDSVVDIVKVLPVRQRTTFLADGDMFIGNMGFNTYNYLASPTTNQMGISDIYIAKQYHEMFKSMFSSSDGFTYSKVSNRVQLDLEVGIDVGLNDFLVFYVKSFINPETYTRTYDERLLFLLASAYAKKFEATNLTKLSGIDLPGGVKFDAKTLKDNADKEISEIEKEMASYYGSAMGIFVS